MRLILAILLAVSATFAQKVLHVSTIPGNADIYVECLRPDRTSLPHHVSPAYIPANPNSEGNILISIFSPGFADTTINVTLSDKDTSFLIVSLRPVYDKKYLQWQEAQVSKRARRQLGYKLMLGSIIPFTASLIAGAVTYYQIDKANEHKDIVENSAIMESERVQKAQREFKQHKNSAKNAKTTTWTTLSIGASLLAVGFVLSF